MSDYPSARQAILDKIIPWSDVNPTEEVLSTGDRVMTRSDIVREIEDDTPLGRKLVENWVALAQQSGIKV